MSQRYSEPVLAGLLAAVVAGVWKLVEGVAFWTAVTLPFVYTPVLVTGAYVRLGLFELGVLLALNAVAFLLGRGHNRPEPTATPGG